MIGPTQRSEDLRLTKLVTDTAQQKQALLEMGGGAEQIALGLGYKAEAGKSERDVTGVTQFADDGQALGEASSGPLVVTVIAIDAA